MSSNDKENIGLKPIIVGYLLHWKLFLGAFLFSLVLAILYLIFYPKTYEMKAAVQIQKDRELAGGGLGLGEASGIMKSFGLGGLSGGSVNLEDELQIFLSNELFRKMILDLGLHVEYSEPYTLGYKLYNTADFSLKADAQTEQSLSEDVEFKISGKSGKIKVKTKTKSSGKKHFEFSELPADIVLPQGTFVLDYAEGNLNKSTSSVNVTYRPASYVAEELIDEFLIEDYSKTANIIELTCSDYVRKRGLDMLTSLIKHYNEQAYSYKRNELDKSIAYYDGRIDSLVTQLLAIEMRIEKYKQTNKLTDVQTDVMFFAEQMKEVQVKLIELEAQAHAVNLMSEFVNKEENRYNLVPMLLTTESGEKNPIVMYNELLLERSRIMQTTKDNHPLVESLTQKADEMRQSVFLTIKNASKTIQLSIQDVKNKESLLYAKMGDFPLQEREFVDLKRQQEIYQGVYLLLLQKREEAALAADNETDKARVFESPYVFSKTVAPRKLFAALFMLVFTLCIPVLYLLIKGLCLELYEEYKKQKSDLTKSLQD